MQQIPNRYPHWKIEYTESTSAAMEKLHRQNHRMLLHWEAKLAALLRFAGTGAY